MIEVKEIISWLEKNQFNFHYRGSTEIQIQGFSSVYHYRRNTITWIKNLQRYDEQVKDIASIELIVIDEETALVSAFSNAIICDNPKFVFYEILKAFFYEERSNELGRNGMISHKASIGKNVKIGCNSVIEDDVVVGDNTRIGHNVIIKYGTYIGKNCVIESGTIIGEEGFGLSEEGGNFYRVPHFGNVVIDDDVEIGANVCIDRGTIENTIIGEGSKIDNLCHIAHNVVVGKNVRIVAMAVICGSAVINDGAYIGPGAIVKNQVSVERNSIVGIGSLLMQDAPENKVLVGIPAKIIRERGKENL